MELKPGYKQTEVGVIPEDWESKPLGDATDLLTGFPFLSSGYTKSGVRLVRGSNVKRGVLDWEEEITKYWPTVSPDLIRYQLRAQDLVIAMDGALVGRSYAIISDSDVPSLLLQRVARIRSSEIHPKLLASWIASDSFVQHVNSVKTHTAIPHISPTEIRNFSIAFPPDPVEQSKIANALSDVDGLIGALDQLIAKKRDLKQAAMQQILTGHTRLPGFTGEWETKKLGDFTGIRNLKVLPSNLNPDTPCVELEQIGQGNGRLLEISTARYSSSSKYSFLKGDVLFGRLRSYLRKHWHADRDGICSTEIWPLMVDPEQAFSGFLHAIVQTDRFIQEASISYGTHMPRADWGVIQNFEVLIPHVDEQAAIAQVISDMDAEIEALEARREKTTLLKKGMMQELLTGKTRLI